MKRLTLISVSIVLLTNLIYSQSIEIKDSGDQLLLEVNDEGENRSSITIPSSGTAPGTPANKLYNEGGALKWNGSTLATGSSLWALNSGNVYRSSGKVGIGTDVPSVELDIISSQVDYASRLRLGNSDKTHSLYLNGGHSGQMPYISFLENDALLFTMYDGNNNELMRIASNGNVGIGTQTPLSKLSVGGIGGNGAVIYGETDTGSGVSGMATGSYSSGISGTASGNESIGVYGLNENFSGPGQTYGGYFEATGANGYGVAGSGNTGVYGYSIDGTGVYGKVFENDGKGVYGYAQHSIGTNYGIYGKTESPNGYAGYFEGNVSVDGNVGIGTTNPLSKLSVGGGGNTFSTIYGETSNETGRGVYGKATSTSSSKHYGGYFEASGETGQGVHGVATGALGVGVSGFSLLGGSWGGYFEAGGAGSVAVAGQVGGLASIGVWGVALGSGGVGVQGTGVGADFFANGAGEDYGSSSSIRWKRNILKIDNPIDKLSEIRGVYFDWDEEHGGEHDVGCIAEEVGKIMPEIVIYEDNGIDARGMDYSKLTPLLVEAVKELKQIVDEQQKRIEYLESN